MLVSSLIELRNRLITDAIYELLVKFTNAKVKRIKVKEV